MKRLFVSLIVPEPISVALAKLNPHLPGIRWVRPGQFHLTLTFLGYVAPENEITLRENLSRIRFAGFFLSLGEVGTFPGKGAPRIIRLGIGRGHPRLFQLHKLAIDAALAAGLEPDLRPWFPHITLARCEEIPRPVVQPFLRAQAEYSAGLVRFDRFALQSSQLTPAGSIHTIELEVKASAEGSRAR